MIGATIKNRFSLQKIKSLAAEYTWAMEEAAEWCKEYIHFDEVKSKNQMSALKIASDPETYAVSEYSEYIPLHVRNAEDKYKKVFYNKHIQGHLGLKMDDINVSYRMLKYKIALTHNQRIEGHYKKMHLLPKGCLSLRKREIIVVNTNLEFKIIDLTEFQSLGPNKQAAQLHSVYTHVVARGVFEESSSRNEAALQKSR